MPVEDPSGAMFDVEICHALPERQTLLTLAVAPGTTVDFLPFSAVFG